MPKHPVSLWLIDERKRRGWKAEEVARRLREAGIDAADGTYRVWESGRKPKDDAIRAMETLFASSAPRDETAPDMSALIAVLTRQSLAIEAMVARFDAQATRINELEEQLLQMAEGQRADAEAVARSAAPTPGARSARRAAAGAGADPTPGEGAR